MKPVISYDPNGQDMTRPDEMPMLASKHRQIGGQKGSVQIVNENKQRLLNENESQNSNSYG